MFVEFSCEKDCLDMFILIYYKEMIGKYIFIMCELEGVNVVC